MSSIGKILIVVNVVLSGLVLGAAGALLSKTEDAKTHITKLEGQVKTAESAKADAEAQYTERERALTAEKTRLEEDKSDLEVARDNADNKAQRLEVDNQQLRDDITKINAKLDTLDSSLTGTMTRNQELTDMNATLREEAMKAKTEAQQSEMGKRDLEDQIAEAKRKVQELEDQIATLSQAPAGGAMAAGGPAGASMPHIEATVKEVNFENGFVVLDKGRNQSVERGYTFNVSRDGTYLGRVKVDQLYANYATALIEEQVPNARFQTGDVASTQAQ
jgi:predicted RNase H-like nuclease (RuvC/YqgF family)